GDAHQREVRDAMIPQYFAEVGVVERALSRLVDDDLARCGIARRDDVVTRFALNQDAAHRPDVADTERGVATREFAGWTIVHVGRMPFTCMDHEHIGLATGGY